MRVMVLGAGGYLGSALVSRFVAAGYTVSGLVRNIPAAEKLELAGAQPVSEAIDAAAWKEVLGTIAGENTILIVCRSPQARQEVEL